MKTSSLLQTDPVATWLVLMLRAELSVRLGPECSEYIRRDSSRQSPGCLTHTYLSMALVGWGGQGPAQAGPARPRKDYVCQGQKASETR